MILKVRFLYRHIPSISKKKQGIYWKNNYSKWFEPRSTSSSFSVIIRVRVVLKGTVSDIDSRFDNLSGSHIQSQRWLPLRLSKR